MKVEQLNISHQHEYKRSGMCVARVDFNNVSRPVWIQMVPFLVFFVVVKLFIKYLNIISGIVVEDGEVREMLQNAITQQTILHTKVRVWVTIVSKQLFRSQKLSSIDEHMNRIVENLMYIEFRHDLLRRYCVVNYSGNTKTLNQERIQSISQRSANNSRRPSTLHNYGPTTKGFIYFPLWFSISYCFILF